MNNIQYQNRRIELKNVFFLLECVLDTFVSVTDMCPTSTLAILSCPCFLGKNLIKKLQHFYTKLDHNSNQTLLAPHSPTNLQLGDQFNYQHQLHTSKHNPSSLQLIHSLCTRVAFLYQYIFYLYLSKKNLSSCPRARRPTEAVCSFSFSMVTPQSTYLLDSQIHKSSQVSAIHFQQDNG